MTLAALAEELATEIGEAYSDTDIALVFNGWVNEAIAELWDQEPWRWTFKTLTLTGTILVSLTGVGVFGGSGTALSVQDVIDVTVSTSPVRLTGTTEGDLLRAGANLKSSGSPTHWYYTESADDSDGAPTVPVILLYPVPTASRTYNIAVTLQCPVLVATDMIPLPPDTIRAIRENVRMRYYENARKLDSAAIHAQRWQDALATLRRRYISSVEIDSRLSYRDVRPGGWPIPRFPNTIG